jgi:glutamate-5-semialdehyde dehydrogenase
MEKIDAIVYDLARLAKQASYKLTTCSSETKNAALLAMAQGLDENRSLIKAENSFDIRLARESALSKAMIDRLMLDERKIDDMIKAIMSIKDLSDPIGKLVTSRKLDNGIELKKVRVPIGVIGIIFESRPNVVADVSALCIKSGNAIILRGGKEAERSNRALVDVINQALQRIDFIPFAVQMIPVADRKAIVSLCKQHEMVDLIIPRGGESLIKAVSDCATVPVIKHYKGVCHVYVDASASEDMALAICQNGKCQRPAVCNAIETILVHEAIAKNFMPKLFDLFVKEQVEMRGDDKARDICPEMKPAQESDWSEEYLDLIISIKVVNNIDEAIHHINCYGSHHSDAIVTKDKKAELQFIKEVDSAAVYVNVSTRFTDGGVFGLGAEMGISTDKLHARGPMGLEELSTYKWIGLGTGQIRT